MCSQKVGPRQTLDKGLTPRFLPQERETEEPWQRSRFAAKTMIPCRPAFGNRSYQAGGLFGVLGYEIRSRRYVCRGYAGRDPSAGPLDGEHAHVCVLERARHIVIKKVYVINIVIGPGLTEPHNTAGRRGSLRGKPRRHTINAPAGSLILTPVLGLYRRKNSPVSSRFFSPFHLVNTFFSRLLVCMHIFSNG